MVKSGNIANVVDVALRYSDVIEETTLMRMQMQSEEERIRTELTDYYRGEEMEYKIPYQVNDFRTFGKKSNKVKEESIRLVMEMYALDQQNRLEMEQDINQNDGRSDTTTVPFKAGN